MVQGEKTLSAILAEFVTGIEFKNLPYSTVRMAVLGFLDWLGSALAGGEELPGRIVTGLMMETGGSPQATVLATGEKRPALSAALANGVCSHILELDDVHKASILHPAAPVIPAALAAAELTGAGGKKLIEGIVAGYDVGIRVGEAVTPSHYRYWHTTGTCGTFGAVAAAGKITGLDAEQLVHALGSAGSMAAGLWEFIADGAMTKHLHPGKAAAGGLLAALLAARGFTGARRILEGERGFFTAMAEEYDAGKITANLGRKFKIEENCFKIHSSCRHTHSAVDVAIQLAGENELEPGEIKKVEVGVYRVALDIAGNEDPQTVYAAKFSLPFCVALGLARRRAGLEDFTPEALADPRLRGLMKRIEVRVDPQLDALHPQRWPARVTVHTERGIFTGRADYPKGDPENPVTEEELAGKFDRLVRPVLGEGKTRSLLAAIGDLPEANELEDILKWLVR